MNTDRLFQAKKLDVLRILDLSPLPSKQLVAALLDLSKQVLRHYLIKLHKDNTRFPSANHDKMIIAQLLVKHQPGTTTLLTNKEIAFLYDELFTPEAIAYLAGVKTVVAKYGEIAWDRTQVSQPQWELIRYLADVVKEPVQEEAITVQDMINQWLHACRQGTAQLPSKKAFASNAWLDEIVDATLIIDRKNVAPIIDGTFWEAIHIALRALPEKQRQVITMYFGFDGTGRKTCKEIAARLEYQGNTVQHWFHTGINELLRNTRQYFGSVAYGVQDHLQRAAIAEQAKNSLVALTAQTAKEVCDASWKANLTEIFGYTQEDDPYPVPIIRGKLNVLIGNHHAIVTTIPQVLSPALLQPLNKSDLTVRGYNYLKQYIAWHAPWVARWKATHPENHERSPFLWELAAQDPWELKTFPHLGHKTMAVFEEVLAENNMHFNTKFTDDQIDYLYRHTYEKS